jgi:transposase
MKDYQASDKMRDIAIIKLIKQGLSYREIGEKYKISHTRVMQIFRKSYPQGKHLTKKLDVLDLYYNHKS